MSNAVATIVNPLSKKETLLFSIAGDKRQLAMSSFSLDEIGTVYPYSDNGVLMGSLATPGALAAVVRRGLVGQLLGRIIPSGWLTLMMG